MFQFPFLPEGFRDKTVQQNLSIDEIRKLITDEAVVEGTAVRCDLEFRLFVVFHGWDGVISRENAVHPAISGAEREIALLSRVGEKVAFVITGIEVDGGGKPTLQLSRKLAQEKVMEWLFSECAPGTVLRGRITRLEPYGAFVDIGCGFIALLPTAYCSVSRVSHPSERFHVGQKILAVVKDQNKADKRITLTHLELLGTWLENAALFVPGETVAGIVRSVQEYGVFVELTPNLVGLAEPYSGIVPGDRVAVYIRSIRPEQMKIKLRILHRAAQASLSDIRYQITDGRLAAWRYAPPGMDDRYAVSFSS